MNIFIALKKYPKDLNIFIEACKNAVRPDCGTDTFEYISSRCSDIDLTLALNSIYTAAILYDSDMSQHIVNAGVKIITKPDVNNIHRMLALEAIARAQEHSPEKDRYSVNHLLFSPDLTTLMHAAWKEFSDGSLEFTTHWRKLKTA